MIAEHGTNACSMAQGETRRVLTLDVILDCTDDVTQRSPDHRSS